MPKTSTIQYALFLPGDTLTALAGRYGVTVNDLEKINIIPEDQAVPGQILRIINAQPPATGAYESLFISPARTTLYWIARHFGVTEAAIRAANEPIDGDTVFRGQVLRIPPLGGGETRVSAPDTLLDYTYVVQAGDTLASVARAFSLTEADLARFNRLRAGETVYPGQILHLTAFGASETLPSFYGAYVVQRGDTLSGIARRFGVTVQALYEANAIHDRSLIVTGQILVIPLA